MLLPLAWPLGVIWRHHATLDQLHVGLETAIPLRHRHVGKKKSYCDVPRAHSARAEHCPRVIKSRSGGEGSQVRRRGTIDIHMAQEGFGGIPHGRPSCGSQTEG